VPTIFVNHLVNLTAFPEAPNGSIKRTERGGEGVPHFLEADFQLLPTVASRLHGHCFCFADPQVTGAIPGEFRAVKRVWLSSNWVRSSDPSDCRLR
jgi:hypothetical protein